MFRSKKAAAFTAALCASVMLLGNSAFAANYTVVKGDTLSRIGGIFNTSAGTVMSENGLKSSVIYPGQVLYVRADTYKVKSGDSLYLIAQRYGISVDTLRTANNKWNDMLYPGQKLAVPAADSVSASSAGKTVVSYTQGEYDLLARLITAEAGSEPYNAQVGVGAVVVNRVLSGRFPDTISSVIYQVDNGYYQFTPVENGWINKPATNTAKKAAYDALHGSDPTNGALYYFDDSATNKWLWSKPLKARYGHMVYVY
jgi:spore germination cell wall hydrolase CwlJ-like protein